jgi:hypothetical protein
VKAQTKKIKIFAIWQLKILEPIFKINFKIIFIYGYEKNMSVMVFGEAERGAYCAPIVCKSLSHLFDLAGSPPDGSLGIPFAIQTLLFKYPLIFFRIEQEGFSAQDYLEGFHWVHKQETPLSALCLPGVGDHYILDAVAPLCETYKSLLILTEKDLYDYLTIK